MHRRGVSRILDALLLAASLAVIVTGLLVDQLDLNEFTPHRWAGYVVALLIAVHVGRHWRWFLPPGRTDPLRRESVRPAAVELPEGFDDPANPTGHDRSHPSRRGVLVAAGAGVAGSFVGWFGRSQLSPDPYAGGDVSLFYHRESSLGLRGLLSDVADWGRRPAPYLRVGDRPTVTLPSLGVPPAMTVAQAMQQRRSLRQYADRALTAEQLAWVVSAATAITSGEGYRTAPSAGALYPLETYVVATRVDGLDPGVYHVDVRAQALEPVRSGSVAGDLMVAGLGQDFLRQAPAGLVLTGLFQRSRWKYRERHYRYVCWEGGHVAQNVYLAAEAVGLGACMVGAFVDGMVNDLIRVDGRREAALGLITLGHR